jgi:hypothetical protein
VCRRWRVVAAAIVAAGAVVGIRVRPQLEVDDEPGIVDRHVRTAVTELLAA